MAKGLYTNSELLDSIIVDFNSFLQSLFTGQAVNACIIASNMSQKLANLRKTIDDDIKNREETIEKLKQALRDAGCNTREMTAPEFMREIVGEQQKEGDA